MTTDRNIRERTCIACRASSDKGSLVRVVRIPGGEVRLDPTGKSSGRGAYVCPTAECVAVALKQKRFDRALRAQTPATLAEDLSKVIAQSREKNLE